MSRHVELILFALVAGVIMPLAIGVIEGLYLGVRDAWRELTRR